MNESSKRVRSSGFTLIELLIVIFSLCGFIGGLGEGWKFGLVWSLVYGLIGLVFGFSVVVVPILAFGGGYHVLQRFFGVSEVKRDSIDLPGDDKDDRKSDGC